ITVGTMAAGRIHPDLEGLIGFCVNTLPLRIEIDPAWTFAQLVQRVRDRTTEAFDHQVYPFDQLVDELDLPRELGRFPLFDVMVVLQNNEQAEFTLPGLTLQRVELRAGVAKFDFGFQFTESDDGLDLVLEYNTNLFRRTRIESMAADLVAVFSAVAAQPEV